MRRTTRKLAARVALWLGAAMGFIGCVPDLSHIACASDENCPAGYWCQERLCVVGERSDDAGASTDAGSPPATADAGAADGGGPTDAGTVDGGTVDGGTVDGGTVDGGTVDGGTVDGGTVDGGTVDGGAVDGGANKPNGQPCVNGDECWSTHCVVGICCASTCGACGSCATGACQALGPGSAGSPSCAPYVCSGATTCPQGCSNDTQCVSTSYCSAPACIPKKANGQACVGDPECQSRHCSNGYCCSSGTCCATASSCPAAFRSAPSCADLGPTTTCQGTRQDATCVDSICGSQSVGDDSACAGAARPCGFYLDVTCSSATSQPVATCPSACAGPSECAHGATCSSNQCLLAESFRGVWGFADNDVWIAGAGGHIMHWNGASWTLSLSNSAYRFNAMWGAQPGDLWAVGYDTNALGGLLLRWQGGTWTSYASNTGVEILGISGSSGSEIWAVSGDAHNGALHHWNGTVWELPVSFNRAGIHGVRVLSATDAWAAGENTSIYRFQGGVWGTLSNVASGDYRAIWASSSTDVTAIGYRFAYQLDGTTWTRTDLSSLLGPTASLNGLMGINPYVVFAVGEQGTVLNGYYGTWSVFGSPGTTQDLYGIWARAPSLLWIVGNGVVLRYEAANGYSNRTPPGIIAQ